MAPVMALALALALVVAARSSAPERNYVRAGTDTGQAQQDLEVCRAYAREEVKVQSDIDQDIAASSTDPYGPALGGATDFSTASTEARFRKIVDQCMSDLGYGVAP